MNFRRRDLDSTALRYFHAAAKLKSVRRAAESLNVSASALSRQIAMLESILQVSLFERMPRGLKLTNAGEILLLHVEQSFREMQRAFDAIDDLKNLKRGHINVALAESAARSLLSPVFSAFWAKHPDIDISLHIVGTFEIIRLLEKGDVDLGVGFNVPAETELPVVGNATFPLGAVMPPGHELAQRSSLHMHDLIGFPVIVSDHSLMLHSALSNAVNALPLHVRAASNSIASMVLLAESGNGIALKTILGVHEEVKRGSLVFTPIRDRRLPLQQVSVVTRPVTPQPARVNVLAVEFATALRQISEKEAYQ